MIDVLSVSTLDLGISQCIKRVSKTYLRLIALVLLWVIWLLVLDMAEYGL